MPKKKKENIKLILKFFDENIIETLSISKIDDLLKLSPVAFNFLEKKDAEYIEEIFNFKEINDLLTLDPKNPFEDLSNMDKLKGERILENEPDFKEKLKKTISITQLIDRMNDKAISVEGAEQKVLIVGLSNAGKTAIISKFGGDVGLSDLVHLEPTVFVDRQEIITNDIKIVLWDVGGQQRYIEDYLAEPEKYFLNVDLIIYVLDIQDSNNYERSLDYLNKIIEILEMFKESPYILIFLHKFDPDIQEEPAVLLNIELVKSKVESILNEKDLDYNINLSSIYSALSKEPKFSKALKSMMKENEFLTDPSSLKLSEMGQIVEKTLNSVINLSEKMMKYYGELDDRITKLNNTVGELQKRGPVAAPAMKGTLPSASSPPPLKPPPSLTPPAQSGVKTNPAQSRGGSPLSLRGAIMGELKELFAKKKSI